MKLRRILAAIGIIILVGMYAATIVFAVSGSDNADALFRASIFLTVIIPAMLYSYILVARIVGKKNGKTDDEEDENK